MPVRIIVFTFVGMKEEEYHYKDPDTYMTGVELKELLDGRSNVWLGRQLELQGPKQQVWQWVHGIVDIPVHHIPRIRLLLKGAQSNSED